MKPLQQNNLLFLGHQILCMIRSVKIRIIKQFLLVVYNVIKILKHLEVCTHTLNEIISIMTANYCKQYQNMRNVLKIMHVHANFVAWHLTQTQNWRILTQNVSNTNNQHKEINSLVSKLKRYNVIYTSPMHKIMFL